MVDARGGGALLPRWVPPFDLHSLSRRAIKKLFQLLLSSSTLHDCTDRDKDYLREAIARVHLTAGGSTTRDERIGLGGFRRVRRARSFSRGIAVGIRAPDTRGVTFVPRRRAWEPDFCFFSAGDMIFPHGTSRTPSLKQVSISWAVIPAFLRFIPAQGRSGRALSGTPPTT